MHTPTTVHLERLPAQLWHAGRKLLETTLIPLGLFYLLFTVVGLTAGLLAALGWAVVALGWRVAVRAPIPAVLVLTTGLLAVRTAIGLVSQSTFLYFLQPSLQNFLIAAVLLASIPLDRTFLARLADDFCVMPAVVSTNARVQRFFRRVSLLWALVFLTNGATTLWALAQRTVGEFLLVSTALSYTVIAIAALGSLLWLRRELRLAGIRLKLRPDTVTDVGHPQPALAAGR